MKNQELEARVLQLVETVLSGHKVEDNRVEFKSTWTPAPYTARQIAGLCNAARGEGVVVIVGVDEDGHRVKKLPNSPEAGQWWGSIVGNFVELAPELRNHLAVPIPGHGVVHVFDLETSRAPYVVKVSERRNVTTEVPWREGAQTRSARRSDLIQTLVERARAPELDLINAKLEMSFTKEKGVSSITYWFEASVYLTAAHKVALPEYRWTTIAKALDTSLPMNIYEIQGPMGSGGGGVYVGTSQPGPNPYANVRYVRGSGLQVDGPDRLRWTCHGHWEIALQDILGRARKIDIQLRMPVSSGDAEAVLDCSLFRRAAVADENPRAFRLFTSLP